MSKPKLLIIIDGGNLQFIAATEDLDIAVIDYDNIAGGDTPGIYEIDAKFIAGEAHTLLGESPLLYKKIAKTFLKDTEF